MSWGTIALGALVSGASGAATILLVAALFRLTKGPLEATLSDYLVTAFTLGLAGAVGGAITAAIGVPVLATVAVGFVITMATAWLFGMFKPRRGPQ